MEDLSEVRDLLTLAPTK